METDRSSFCGCKGIRTCLLCEKVYGLQEKAFESEEYSDVLSYCWNCGKCHSGRNVSGRLDEIPCTGEGTFIPGILILPDFISISEENKLIDDLDQIPWTLSQSGRRKQNYGPKCNFKKRKLKPGDFNGFPQCSKFIQDRFNEIDLLRGYRSIEQCSLEYDPEKGSSIEPHIDDCWVWGERIITLSLLSDCVLSLKPFTGPQSKYNLDCVPCYKCSVNKDVLLRIPMPRRSLLVLTGEARYAWEHMILRRDVLKRRVCITYREFTPPYLPNGELFNQSSDIIQKSLNYFPT